ncbi:MAG: LysE family translocator [Bacteroidales bacterium]|jgi:threonine/homoserine/homoserine lactone efflux protein|uniref:Homoserine/homoserine lactone efflux protein n=1 Tax=bioreactor metagenome TaxID=1076179 RepID=A0A644TTE9_9ZZZZ|nr:LysE family translocator [Bacteroidales bacterium]MEA4967530.1 LysE family translocator [Bacteroidaceae bacterium]MDD2576339.1 LysE family translocator [Bacteroidales bacterium]MDD3667153.1 LysE family translocator [Bacteroidales bacterium]MDD4067614.1 LysE family translocator [Bacteroidales bacterium]
MHFFQTITQGILFGLTLSLMAGPAFFSLIQTSISKGFKKGSQLAFGISISDIIMVFVAWYGLSSIFETNKAQRILSVVGGFFLLGFGVYTALKRHITKPKQAKDIEIKTKFQFKYIAKGFAFNILNPSIWIFWLIPISVASSFPKINLQITFLASILVTVLCMDLIKCAIANEIKRFMTDRVITYTNRIIGSILIVFGIYLILTLFIDMSHIIPINNQL